MVKSWALNRYRDEQNNSLDLVDSLAAKQYGNPFSIWVSDEAMRQELNGALFVPSESGEIHAPATLTFEYSTGRIAARKEISFNAKDYVVEIKTDVWSDGKPIAHSVAWPGGFGDVHDLGMRGNQLDAYYRDPLKITRWTSGDIKAGTLSASGSFLFAGIEDRFFTASFLPQEGPLRVAALRQDVAVAGQSKPRPSLGLTVGSGEGQQNRLRVFVGPKDTDVLAAVAPHLPETVDYGWFAIVAKPLFVAMRWIHDHIISNYGWAIILLTVFINFLLFPLKLKSLRSSMKMQKIQPQMRAIQDKYKQYKMNDPRKQEMQREMMELYKEHGVNPIGGCLPMLIQMPFLYGFYKVLVVSIEMRHAPWIFWIHDLSEPEKLPIKLAAAGDDRHPVRAAKDEPVSFARPGPAEDDDVHADHVPVYVLEPFERFGDLLADGKHRRDRAAVVHQSHGDERGVREKEERQGGEKTGGSEEIDALTGDRGKNPTASGVPLSTS